MPTSPGVVTFLFTDIEGSSRLWEEEPERMRSAMEGHDAICRAAVRASSSDVPSPSSAPMMVRP